MHFCKIKVNMKMFIILSFIGIQIICVSTDDSRSVLPENDYVLRSCMSSVELNRRNVDVSKRKWPVSSQRSSSPIATVESLPTIRSTLSHHRVKSAVTKAHGQLRKTLGERSMGRRRPARKMIADTPLRTLNVKRRGRDDPPQVFMKNNLLPEIRSLKLNTKSSKSEASVIVIETTSQIPFGH